MRNLKKSTLLTSVAKTVFTTTALGVIMAPAAYAASVTGTPTISLSAGGNCGVLAGTSSSNKFFITGQYADSGSNDELTRVVADANGTVIASNTQKEFVPVGQTNGYTNGLSIPNGNYAGPLSVGYQDTGSASGSGTDLVGLIPISSTALTAAGGVCASIVSNFVGVNQAPTANAGPDQSLLNVPSGTIVTLNGTASSDPDAGDTLSYSWSQISGPGVVLNGAHTAQPNFPYPQTKNSIVIASKVLVAAPSSDELIFELVVSDGSLSSTSDQVKINISINDAPVADAGTDQTITNGTANTVISLDGSDSSDPDGDGLTYSWVQNSGPSVTLSSGFAQSPSFSYDPGTNVAAQTFGFDLVVNDGSVNSVVDSVSVTFNPNVSPITVVTAPVTSVTGYVAGEAISVTGSGSTDGNNDTLTYLWEQVSGPSTGFSNAAAADTTFTIDTANLSGSYTVVLKLTTSDGVTSSEKSITLTVDVNGIPVASAGIDQNIDNPTDGQSITLDGSGSTDPEGDTLTYRWTQTSGRSVTLSNASASSPTFDYDFPSSNALVLAKSDRKVVSTTTSLPADEEFTFELIVNDGAQDSVVDSLKVSVVNNQAPTANAGADIGPINALSTVTLNGSASTDPDGDSLTYSWSQISGTTVSLSDEAAINPTFEAPDVSGNQNMVFELTVDDGNGESSTDQVTVTVQPNGSITIIQKVTGSDDSFGFTSDAADLNVNLLTVEGTAQATVSDLGEGDYAITAADMSAAGYKLTSLVCTDDDGSVELDSRMANITLSPGEDVTCTFTSVNSREAAQSAIARALTIRSQLLLASEPDVRRRIDRLRGTSSAANSVKVNGYDLPGSSYLPVKANLSEKEKTVSASLSAAKANNAYKGALDNVFDESNFDIWGEAQISSFELGQSDGTFNVYYVGADVLLHEDVLVGALVQFDEFELENIDNVGDVQGDGFMAGPYMTVRVQENFYLDARVAWGTSENTVNPLGSFTDEFTTDRALISGTATGEFKLKDKWTLRPELAIRHLSEEQNRYVDSYGISIPQQVIEVGEISFGPELSTQFKTGSGWTLSPYGSVEGVYSYGDDVEALFDSQTRLRAEAGTSLTSEAGARVNLSAFVDGIGSEDSALSRYGVRVSLSYVMK